VPYRRLEGISATHCYHHTVIESEEVRIERLRRTKEQDRSRTTRETDEERFMHTH